MNTKWKEACLTDSASIKEAMQLLSNFGTRIVIVVDQNMLLLGTVTDGDIRRGILRALPLEASISEVMFNTPTYITEGMTAIEIKNLFHEKKLIAAPVVNSEMQVIGLEDIAGPSNKPGKDISVLIMAGGFGKRLGDLTKEVPKPMLPLGTKPILEHIVDSFNRQGFKKFFISTHYKSQTIKEHFKNGEQKGIAIDYLEEELPLGTAGCIYFLKDRVADAFIVINGDLLVDFDFSLLLEFHKKNNALVTMCVRQSKFHVPYGVVETEKMEVKSIIEKPNYTHYVNAGMYCFSLEALQYITDLDHIDMPELLQKFINDKQKVLAFPLHEYWADIGSYDTLSKARAEHLE